MLLKAMQPQNKEQQRDAQARAITHTSCGTAKGNTNTKCMKSKENKTTRKKSKSLERQK